MSCMKFGDNSMQDIYTVNVGTFAVTSNEEMQSISCFKTRKPI